MVRIYLTGRLRGRFCGRATRRDEVLPVATVLVVATRAAEEVERVGGQAACIRKLGDDPKRRGGEWDCSGSG